MGANLSGRYGGILVDDTGDIVFFSREGSSLKAVIRDIALSVPVVLLSLWFLATFTSFPGTKGYALCWVLSIAIVIILEASRATLLLRFPDHTWVTEKVFPTHQPIAHGDTCDLKEIMVMELSDDGYVTWHLTLKWKAGRTLGYKLGIFPTEHEARAFAEDLSSRLGIPVVDQPIITCSEIMPAAMRRVEKIKTAALNRTRLGTRKG